jgi:ribosomal protein L13E
MFGRGNFRDCITDNLKAKGYGKKRTEAVLQDFERRVKEYDAQGMSHPDADMQAMQDVFNRLTEKLHQDTKRAAKDLAVTADMTERVKQGLNVKTSSWVMDGKGGGGYGVGLTRAGLSMYTDDARFAGISLDSVRRGFMRKYWSLMGDVMENFRKGAFGHQVGASHLSNIVRELYGRSTGDQAAKEIATAIRKVQNTMVDDFNMAGGSLRKLQNYIMPQKQNAVKVTRAGAKQWIEDHDGWVDWGKMRWPDGDVIEVSERQGLLNEIYSTFATDGATKIQPGKMGGRGGGVGNMLDKHRFLIYKNAESWLAMHEKYGDGNVFDVFSSHVQAMAHKNALVTVLGNNPDIAFQRLASIIRAQAGNAQRVAISTGDKKGLNAVQEAEAVIKNKLEPMHQMITHQNPLDVTSPLANVMQMTSHVLTSAQLGGILFAAMPSDFVTTLSVRLANHMPLLSGIGTYIKGIAPGGYREAEKLSARAGFVFDETIAATYAAERFTGLATYGPAMSARLSDATMRLGMITRHTNIARWTAAKEHMGMLDHFRDITFDNLPNRYVLERYGITAKEWDAVRALPAWSPNGKATFMRPLDILETNWITKQDTYNKFHNMIDAESRAMVPTATLEGSVALKGLTRPDTLRGAILHSFAMYKNFPASMMMLYGRQFMATPGAARRVGFLAGLGVGLLGVGALSIQLKEISRGRTPLPMDRGAFWGKAILASGALSLWGDFLFSGVNDIGRGPTETMAGPIGGLAMDSANLVFGDGFAFTDAIDRGREWDVKFGARLAEFAKRYTPGTNIWYARLVLEREVWDQLQYQMDKNAQRKFARRIRRQEKDFGNRYWSKPGEPLFTR